MHGNAATPERLSETRTVSFTAPRRSLPVHVARDASDIISRERQFVSSRKPRRQT
jgi:hypothetical protein